MNKFFSTTTAFISFVGELLAKKIMQNLKKLHFKMLILFPQKFSSIFNLIFSEVPLSTSYIINHISLYIIVVNEI